MGNCVDIPSSPPKRSFYLSKHFRSAGRGTVPSNLVYSNQPYTAYAGASPLMAVDPMSGQAYSYPMMTDILARNNSYTYFQHDKMWESCFRQQPRPLDTWAETRGLPDKTGNRNVKSNAKSTIITTYPNPEDDVIKRGYEIIISNSTPGQTNGVMSITSGSIKTFSAAAKRTTQIASTSQEEIAFNHDVVILLQVSAAPVATRGSTYITYIDDIVQSEEEATEVKIRNAGIEEELQNMEEQEQTLVFQEVTDEDNVQLFIDDPLSEQTAVNTFLVRSDSFKRIHSSSTSCPDVALSYALSDVEAMRNIKSHLELAGMTVAVSHLNSDITADNLAQWLLFPQTIIDAKMLVVILSPASVTSQQLREEVSLAHLTDTAVFPVTLVNSMDILNRMDIHLKLQLASYQWTELLDQDGFDIKVSFLVRAMVEELEILRRYEIIDEDFGQVSSWAQKRQKIVQHRQFRRFVDLGSDYVTAAHFWNKTYASGEDDISFERFYQDLLREYRCQLKSWVPVQCTLNLKAVLRRELMVNSEGQVHKANFLEFCADMGIDQDLWERLRKLSQETQAIRDVFDVESTVRGVAIENLGKFGSSNVMSALQELLTDPDPNIRAVATLSLSRCALAGDQVTLTSLMRMLDDKDRLVREAGCQAMGYLSARKAISKLLHIWRNDKMFPVREAAATALNQIGGKEVEEAMRITHVLSDQINQIKL